jgi:single-stranded DNA-binding protein
VSYIEGAVMGRLGNPLARRVSKTGKPFATLSLAAQANGEENPTWVNVTIFPPLLDEVPELVRGEKCYAEGPLQLRSWEKDGETRTSLQLTARVFLALDRIGRRRRPKRMRVSGLEESGMSAVCKTGKLGVE